MSSTLWQKANYAAKIQYVIDSTIREFDISKANISVLRDANVLTEDQYQYYLKAPRMERQIVIGKLQGSDSRITNILKDGITNAKKVFMQTNSIQDSEILYIRNDAIAIIGPRVINNLAITSRVSFRESARYSSFYRFNAIDMLYFYDPVTNTERLDLKGLGDEGVELHKKFMLDFLCELFYRAQIDGVQEAISLIQTFHKNYVDMQLPIEYYRELNSQSRYKLLPSVSMYSSIYMDYATDYHKRYLDISYNEALLRHFNRIFASIYFK